MSNHLKTIDEIVSRYAVTANPLKRRLYIFLGCMFVFFAIIGVWIPGWPTVSWAVPAAFLFSLSSENLFRWTLTNRYFGTALFSYYASGKSLPWHVKIIIMLFIGLMSGISAYAVFLISYPEDPGYGPGSILLVGILGICYIATRVRTRK